MYKLNNKKWTWIKWTRHGSQATVVRNTLWIYLFRREIYLAQKVWRKFPTYGHVNQSRNLEKGVNAIYWIGKRSSILPLYEEERSLENRSYDVSILGSGMMSYIPTTQFYNKTWHKQPGAVSLRVMKLTAGNQQRWLKNNASGQEKDGIWGLHEW